MANRRIFFTFLWKNYLQMRHSWVSQSLIFVGCISILYMFVASSKHIFETKDASYEKIDLMQLKIDYFPGGEDDFILYTPATPTIQQLMEECQNELELQADRVKSFNTKLDMQLYMERVCKQNCFSISFDDIPENGESDDLRYTISSSAMTLSTEERYENDEQVNEGKDTDDYIRVGLLTLKAIIDRKWIAMKSQANHETLPQVFMESMPTIGLKYMDSKRLVNFGSTFNILLNILLLSTFLIPLIEEKQNGLRTLLKISSAYSYLNGITFFLIRFFVYIIFLIIVIILAVYGKTAGLVSIPIIALLFAHQILAAMSFTYLISLLFQSVFYAKVGGLVLLMLPNLFSMFKGGLSHFATIVFYTKAFNEGLNTLQTYNNKHKSFNQFGDMSRTLSANSWSLSAILLILLFQILMHFVCYWYFSKVMPAIDGERKSYFFFLNLLFKRNRRSMRGEKIECSLDESQENAIIIENLCKKFKSKKRKTITISDNLNMTIKNKQITVLLGHNGAGKTTTLSMIIGTVAKDSGKITVCSERNVENYRHLIGFCPQHNIFLPYLTCKQHLIFFALLREYPDDMVDTLAKKLLIALKLCDKENVLGCYLSGGMKRRLAVGVALAGDTKVIVLDEPSSGLDIESRRELWDVLLEIRKTKAILITTHHMEEAEILGDTVSILSNGKLIKTGTPLELKRSSGSGYILKLELGTEHYDEIFSVIHQKISTASVLSYVSPTLLINLPYSERQNYQEVLRMLEDKKSDLGIKSMSVTDTSLDDVFLSTAIEEFSGDVVDSPQVSRADEPRVPYNRLDSMKETTAIKQYKAIIYKRCMFLYNDYIFSIIMILIAFLSCVLALWLMKSTPADKQIMTELPLNLRLYENHIVYLHQSENVPQTFLQLIQNQLRANNIQIRTLTVPQGSDLTQEIWKLQKKDVTEFLQNVIGILDIHFDKSCHIYFQTNIYHSSIILLNLVDNALLKFHQPSSKQQASIETSYRPAKRLVNDISESRLEYYPLIVSCGFFFYLFLFIKIPFIENESGFKDLQVSVPRLTYWLANLFFDILLHLLVCLFFLLGQIILMPVGLYSNLEQSLIMFSIFIYGISYLPLLYMLANNFRSISTISTYLLLIFIISSIMAPITSHNIHSMQHFSGWIGLLCILPDFNLNHQLRVINENFLETRKNKLSLIDNLTPNKDYGSLISPGTFFIYAVAFFLSTFIMFIRLLEDHYVKEALVDLLYARPCRQQANQCLPNSDPEADVDEEDSFNVHNHFRKQESVIDPKDIKTTPLYVESLFKRYTPQSPLVVKNLNFTVRKAECFGLLGVNGAGKTSTFQMIASNATISLGSIKIMGYDIKCNRKQYNYRFGYCPQYDALNFYLTSYQLLCYMGELRGLYGQELETEVCKWLKELEMDKYKDVQCRYYSGGMKRKLNSALAMIGLPALILLDEPTNGVDPVSRRLLWKCIKNLQKQGKPIVLTSHSMDECEQLCNRLAIMANGKIQCTGSIQSLKAEHENGFTITIKMKDSYTDSGYVNDIKNALLQQMENATLREDHYGTLTFVVSTKQTISWSQVFHKMEIFYATYSNYIEDYSINESKLEDIILKFKKQHHTNNHSNNIEDIHT